MAATRDRAERRSLVAGGLGWMLDAMDVMLYSLVLAHLMRDLGMGKAEGGLLNSLTLLPPPSAGWPLVPGRPRRPHARADGLDPRVLRGQRGLRPVPDDRPARDLPVHPGLGMGGEWTTGAALIAETWPRSIGPRPWA
jgi:MFS family permease